MPSKQSRRFHAVQWTPHARRRASACRQNELVKFRRYGNVERMEPSEGLNMVSYFVSYRGSSSDPDLFRAHYETQHVAILRRFPKIRSLVVHQPTSWNDPMPVRRGETFL